MVYLNNNKLYPMHGMHINNNIIIQFQVLLQTNSVFFIFCRNIFLSPQGFKLTTRIQRTANSLKNRCIR